MTSVSREQSVASSSDPLDCMSEQEAQNDSSSIFAPVSRSHATGNTSLSPVKEDNPGSATEGMVSPEPRIEAPEDTRNSLVEIPEAYADHLPPTDPSTTLPPISASDSKALDRLEHGATEVKESEATPNGLPTPPQSAVDTSGRSMEVANAPTSVDLSDVIEAERPSEQEMGTSQTNTPAPHEDDRGKMDVEGEEEIENAAQPVNEVMDIDEPSHEPSSVPPSSVHSRPSSPALGDGTSKAKVKKVKTGSSKPGPKPGSKHAVKADKGVKGTSKAAKPVVKKPKTKADGTKKSKDKLASSNLITQAKEAEVGGSGATTPSIPTEEIDSDDDAVYCICRKPYSEEDDEVTMVACESCENWFHLACVGMTEEQLALVDIYICAECEKSTTLRTAYRRVCKRDRCDNTLKGSSKYCSKACAFGHMTEQIPPSTNQKVLKQLTSYFVGIPPPEHPISIIKHRHAEAQNDGELEGGKQNGGPRAQGQIDAIQKRIEEIDEALEEVKRRQDVLQRAMSRCEGLVLPAQPQVEDKKSKKRSSGVDEKPCGWDKRLILDPDELEEYNARLETSGDADLENGENMEGICMLPRRRCDRHQNWQKVNQNSCDLEIGQLTRLKKDLNAHIKQLQDSEEASKTGDMVMVDLRGRLPSKELKAG